MKKIGLVLVFVSLLCLLGTVNADNEYIAIHEVPATPTFIASTQNSLYTGGACIMDIYPIPLYEHIFPQISQIYNFSLTIPKTANNKYCIKYKGSPNDYCKNYRIVNLTFTPPKDGLFDIYLAKLPDPTGSYDWWLAYDVLNSSGDIVFSYNCSSGVRICPLNNINSSLNLSVNQTYTITIDLSDSDTTQSIWHYPLADTYIVFSKLWLVERNNLSVPSFEAINLNDTYYHVPFSIDVIGKDNLEIMDAWTEVTTPSNEIIKLNLTKQGHKWKPNLLGNLQNYFVGNYTFKLCIRNSYNLTNCTVVTKKVFDAPDFVIKGIKLDKTKVVAGDVVNGLVEVFNNGTISGNFSMNLTMESTPQLLLTVNDTIPAQTSKIYNFTVPTAGKGGKWHKIKAILKNVNATIKEYELNNENLSLLKVAFNTFFLDKEFKQIIPKIELYDNNSNLLFSNLTANISTDYIDIITNQPSDWWIIRFYYNETYLKENLLSPSEVTIYWWNDTSQDWVALSEDISWVNDIDVDTTNNYVWLNTSHLSSYSIVFAKQQNQNQNQQSGSSGSTGGGGGGSAPTYKPVIKNIKKFSWYAVVYGKNSAPIDKEIAEKLRDKFGAYYVKCETELNDYDKKNRNLILVGGIYANGLTAEINNKLKYPMIHEYGKRYHFSGHSYNKSMGILQVIEEKNCEFCSKRKILVVAGLTREGTKSMADILLSDEYKNIDKKHLLR